MKEEHCQLEDLTTSENSYCWRRKRAERFLTCHPNRGGASCTTVCVSSLGCRILHNLLRNFRACP